MVLQTEGDIKMLDAELKTLKRRKYLEYVCEKCKYVTFRIDAES